MAAEDKDQPAVTPAVTPAVPPSVPAAAKAAAVVPPAAPPALAVHCRACWKRLDGKPCAFHLCEKCCKKAGKVCAMHLSKEDYEKKLAQLPKPKPVPTLSAAARNASLIQASKAHSQTGPKAIRRQHQNLPRVAHEQVLDDKTLEDIVEKYDHEQVELMAWRKRVRREEDEECVRDVEESFERYVWNSEMLLEIFDVHKADSADASTLPCGAREEDVLEAKQRLERIQRSSIGGGGGGGGASSRREGDDDVHRAPGVQALPVAAGRPGSWNEVDRAIDLIDCCRTHAQLSAYSSIVPGGARGAASDSDAKRPRILMATDICIRSLLHHDDSLIVTEL